MCSSTMIRRGRSGAHVEKDCVTAAVGILLNSCLMPMTLGQSHAFFDLPYRPLSMYLHRHNPSRISLLLGH